MKIDIGSSELNEATCLLIDCIREIDGDVSPALFNNLKGALKESIELFLTLKLEEKPE